MTKAQGAAEGGQVPEPPAPATAPPAPDHEAPRGVRPFLPPLTIPNSAYSSFPPYDYPLPATGRIFLGRVRAEVGRGHLARALAPFGRVIDCRIVSTFRSGRSKRFAFVDFDSPAAATAAIAAMHGNTELGDPYLLAAHSTDEMPSSGGSPGDAMAHYPPWDPQQQVPWVEDEINRFQYMQYVYAQQQYGGTALRPSPYGLPWPPGAAAAAAVGDGGEAPGLPISPPATTSTAAVAPMAVPLPPGAAPAPPPPPSKDGPVTTLYVRGLPVDMDEFGLLNLYARYGTIYATKILRNLDSYESRGSGFVEFSTLTEAQGALEATNRGCGPDGRSLRVQFADRQLRLSKGGFQAVWPVCPPPLPPGAVPAGVWPPGAAVPPPPPLVAVPQQYHHAMSAQEMAALSGSGRNTPSKGGGGEHASFRRAGDPVVVWSTLSADSTNRGGPGAQHAQHAALQQQRMGCRSPSVPVGAYSGDAYSAAVDSHFAVGYTPLPFVPGGGGGGGGGGGRTRRGLKKGYGSGSASAGRCISSQDADAQTHSDSETTVQAPGPGLPSALTPDDRSAISSRVKAAAQTVYRANSGGLGGASASSVVACNGSVGGSATSSGGSDGSAAHSRRPSFAADDSMSPPTGRHSDAGSGDDSVASCGTGAAVGDSPAADADDVAQATSRLTLAA